MTQQNQMQFNEALAIAEQFGKDNGLNPSGQLLEILMAMQSQLTVPGKLTAEQHVAYNVLFKGFRALFHGDN